MNGSPFRNIGNVIDVLESAGVTVDNVDPDLAGLDEDTVDVDLEIALPTGEDLEFFNRQSSLYRFEAETSAERHDQLASEDVNHESSPDEEPATEESEETPTAMSDGAGVAHANPVGPTTAQVSTESPDGPSTDESTQGLTDEDNPDSEQETESEEASETTEADDEDDDGRAWCGRCGNEFSSERGVKIHNGRSHDADEAVICYEEPSEDDLVTPEEPEVEADVDDEPDDSDDDEEELAEESTQSEHEGNSVEEEGDEPTTNEDVEEEIADESDVEADSAEEKNDEPANELRFECPEETATVAPGANKEDLTEGVLLSLGIEHNGDDLTKSDYAAIAGTLTGKGKSQFIAKEKREIGYAIADLVDISPTGRFNGTWDHLAVLYEAVVPDGVPMDWNEAVELVDKPGFLMEADLHSVVQDRDSIRGIASGLGWDDLQELRRLLYFVGLYDDLDAPEAKLSSKYTTGGSVV